MIEQVKLPNVDGEEVQIIEICVKVGDSVSEDDPLVVVETQKASMDIPAPFSGTIKALHVKEGDKIAEGALICEMAKVGDIKEPEASQDVKESLEAKEIEDGENCEIIDNKKICKVVEDIFVPNLDGEFEVVEVLVGVNDSVDFENSLMILQNSTGKTAIPSPYGGVIKELYVKKSDRVKSGDNIGKIVKEVVEFLEPKKEKNALEDESIEEIKEPHFINEGKIYASPSIRRVAKKYGVNLALVKGSGRKGRILKEDVRVFIKKSLSDEQKETKVFKSGLEFDLPPSKEIDFSKFGEVEIVKLSRIQKISGPFLHKNYLSMPHITQFDQCDITELESFRKSQNEINLKKQNGIKFSPLVFVLKAVAKTLQIYPKFNTSLVDESLVYKKYIHIGVAVDTPEGLVVPVIKDVDKKGFNALANDLKDISQKARDGKLKLQDMQGGCFTISSLGGIGGTYFTPIINAPEVAILGLSKSQMQPVWNGKEFEPRLILPLSLSYDHKVIDGADGARFTSTLAELLSDIKKLLL